MYTVQMWLWRCGIRVSLNWLKSIGNRKRCRVLHSQSFWYSRDVSVPAPHVMASHEHTYIWSPTAASSEQIRAKALWLSVSFSETQPRLQLSGFLFPLSQYCSDFLDLDVGPKFLQTNCGLLRSKSHVKGTEEGSIFASIQCLFWQKLWFYNTLH